MANKRRKFDPGYRKRKRQETEHDEREGEAHAAKRRHNLPGSSGRIPKKGYAIVFGYVGTGKPISAISWIAPFSMIQYLIIVISSFRVSRNAEVSVSIEYS